jgi:hypothetical protein
MKDVQQEKVVVLEECRPTMKEIHKQLLDRA